MPPVKVKDTGRVERLISLAYLLSTRSEIHIEELEERLNVDRNTLEEDLNVLMFCGLPPYSPEQLFDIIIEDDYVSMLYNDVFVKPLRLSENELAQSVVALQRLASADADQSDIINETINIINAGKDVPIKIDDENNEYIELAIKAYEKNVPLEIEYLSLNSASLSRRTIDVVKLFTNASLTYIFGYCHGAKALRLFRSDRIINIAINVNTNVEYDPDIENHDIEIEASMFMGDITSYADLKINQSCSWILDSYPHETIDAGNNIYRFYTASPFFIARLLLSTAPEIQYLGGSFKNDEIINAIETITSRMNS